MLQLIDTDAERVIEIAGARFFTRRLSAADTAAISRTMAGYQADDQYAHAKSLCKVAVRRWEGVGGDPDNPVEYRPELIDRLPLEIMQALSLRIQTPDTSGLKKKSGSRPKKRS